MISYRTIRNFSRSYSSYFTRTINDDIGPLPLYNWKIRDNRDQINGISSVTSLVDCSFKLPRWNTAMDTVSKRVLLAHTYLSFMLLTKRSGSGWILSELVEEGVLLPEMINTSISILLFKSILSQCRLSSFFINHGNVNDADDIPLMCSSRYNYDIICPAPSRDGPFSNENSSFEACKMIASMIRTHSSENREVMCLNLFHRLHSIGRNEPFFINDRWLNSVTIDYSFYDEIMGKSILLWTDNIAKSSPDVEILRSLLFEAGAIRVDVLSAMVTNFDWPSDQEDAYQEYPSYLFQPLKQSKKENDSLLSVDEKRILFRMGSLKGKPISSFYELNTDASRIIESETLSYDRVKGKNHIADTLSIWSMELEEWINRESRKKKEILRIFS